MSSNKGWVSVNRSITDHWIWSEEFSKGQAWIDLILLANHKDADILIKGQKLTVERGQLAWSELSLSKRWKWSRNKVRRFFDMLKKEGMILQKTGHLTSVITICNYSSFQDSEKKAEQQTEQQTEQQANTWRNTDNNVNNNNNVNNSLNPSLENTNECGGDQKSIKRKKNTYSPEFDQFWKLCLEQYKRAGDPPGNKSEAMQAWKALQPDQEMIGMIRDKLIEQASIREKSKSQGHRIDPFKHVVRWLKKSGWEDVVMPRTEPNRNNSKYPATQTTSRLMEM